MAKIKQDFSIFVGEDKDIIFTITDESGAAVDLSAAEQIIWGLFRLRESAEQLLVERLGSGIAVSGVGSNLVTVSLSSGDTEDIISGKYRHELRLVAAGGAESVLAIGQCQFYNSLTSTLVTAI